MVKKAACVCGMVASRGIGCEMAPEVYGAEKPWHFIGVNVHTNRDWTTNTNTERIVTPPNMRIGDAATYMGVADRTIRQWIAEGKIPAHRMGQRVIRLRQSDLDEALQVMGNG